MATISKNIFWSTLTSALQLYTGSIIFIALAKLMSVHDFGILSFGHSLSAIIVILADFGFALMIIKDYPLLGSNDKGYLSNSLLAKGILSFFALVICSCYLIFFYQGEWRMIGALYSLYAVISAYAVYLQSLLKIRNQFKKFAESNIVFAIMVTVTILFYWYCDLNLIQLVMGLLLAKIIQLAWILFQTGKIFQSTNGKDVNKLLKKSWSFGLHTVLGILYFMIDTQLISIYLDARDVALYQSVFRIILIILIFSDIVSSVLLPYLSYKYHNDEDLSELTSKIFLYLLIIGCSLFLFFTSFDQEILSILYTPEYLQAVILVLPLSIVVVLRTISSLLGNILTISNRQVYRVLTVGVSLVVSLTLNLILIPKYGITAAAWVSVGVHVVLFSMYLLFSKMEVKDLRVFHTSNFLIVLISAVLYGVIRYFETAGYLVIVSCTLLWLLAVYFIMKKDNNFAFLQQVLKEKGGG